MLGRSLLAVLVGLSVVLSLSGCGCGSDDVSTKWGGMSEEEWRLQHREKQEAEAREEAAQKKRAEQRKLAAKAKQRALAAKERKLEKETEGNQKTVAAKKSQPPPLPSLPDVLDDWTRRDYLNARAAEAPVLRAAVKHLAEKTVGDRRVVDLLAKLLAPPPLESIHTAARRRQNRRHGRKDRDSEGLVEIIVAALGTNGTEPARKTLVQLLRGQVDTEDDQAAARAAVKALIDNPCPENEDILFGLLTAEEVDRRPARGKLRPNELRKLAIELLRPAASSRLRLRVAHWMVEAGTPRELRDGMRDLVDRTRPEGLEANVFLLVSRFTPAATKTTIMEQFTPYSSQALASALRIPSAEPAAVSAPGWAGRVVRQLWSQEFCGFLEAALGRVDSLKGSIEPVALAATVPTDAARAALYRTLSRHWTDGPAALEPAGVTGSLVVDPGLLVMVQMLVYEEIPQARRLVAASSARPMSADSLRRIKAARETWEGELGHVAEDWAGYFESLQSATCQQLFAASARRPVAALATGLSANSAPGLPQLPVELHAGAQVIATYHLDWSHELQGRLGPVTVDPLEVCYVHIEEETRLTKMLGTYRRRLEPCVERMIENGFVLEGLQNGGQPGRKRSAAVRVTRAMPEIPRLPNQDQPLIVEILSVEVNDPSNHK